MNSGDAREDSAIDREQRRAAREAAADPEAPGARLHRIMTRARAEGPQATLDLLHDRELWNQADPPSQDCAIGQVAVGLGAAFSHLVTARYDCGGQSHRIATFRQEATGIELNLVPGGRFLMGEMKYADEQPVHAVVIGRPFLIGRFPLRQSEWDRVGGEDNRKFRGPDRPIERVSWRAARAWLAKAGDGLRLASEAEWEYACRAGTCTTYFWGLNPGADAMDGAYCWYGENSDDRSHAVTEHEHKANSFGLVDMCGNVLEWCQDDYFDDYEGGPRDEAPRGDGSASKRVVRGGAYDHDAAHTRSAFRFRSGAGSRGGGLGLRVLRSIAWGPGFGRAGDRGIGAAPGV